MGVFVNALALVGIGVTRTDSTEDGTGIAVGDAGGTEGCISVSFDAVQAVNSNSVKHAITT